MNNRDERDESETTYYDVFGLSRSASDEDIGSAYREQTKEYHPDRSDRPEATDIFADVNQAKEALLDGSSRTERPGNNQSLNYVWRDGTPVHPTEDEPDSSNSAGGGERRDGPDSSNSAGGGERRDDQSATNDEGQNANDDPWNTDENTGGGHADPDPDDVVIGQDETSEPTAEQEGLTRREIVAMAGIGGGGLLFANQLWSNWSDDDEGSTGEEQPTGSEEPVTVGPDESIQDAIDAVVPNGTVELEPGTYEESITITKPIEISSPEGATLDGHNIEDAPAVELQTSNVIIRGLTIVRFSVGGIIMTESDTLQPLHFKNIELTDNSGPPISVSGRTVELDDITVNDTGKVESAIFIQSRSDGEVTVRDVTVERTEGQRNTLTQDEIRGRGLHITDGKFVTIENLQSKQNFMENLQIDTDETRGQTVEIRDATLVENTFASGLRVNGSSGTDEVTLKNVTSSEHGGRGININGDKITLEEITAVENGKAPAGIRIRSSSDGEVTVRDVTVERTAGQGDSLTQDEIRGRGLHITDGETVTVENLQSKQNFSENLQIDTDETRGQTVEIRDATLVENTLHAGLHVTGSSGNDEVTLKNVTSSEHDWRGIDITGNKITLEESTAVENGKAPAGIRIRSSADGEVTVRDVTVERTAGQGDSLTQDEIRGRGLHITDGETVTVENLQSKQNFIENLQIDTDETRGQTVEIRDTTLVENTFGSGLRINGSSGNDEIVIENAESNDHDSYGYNLAGEQVKIKNSSADGNGDGPLNLQDISREEATIENSFDNNE